ncbi:hypothetical protein N7478_006393 [Penicillium angulare]|uniref:uncharacterized protein n=1 Tax=Penicillium angulare TaxID=116970 RepID=UPI00253FC5D9|nr:uncharacterized protein N7478_006393 [Penicillium angulare]KAJ5281021.1 hypothetical protein N7478_006393 [Penicillium angulare]
MPTTFAKQAPEPVVGDVYFYHLNMMISGVCTALVCVIIFGLMFWHSIHLSKPREQIKIMKICLLLPLYAVVSFLSICFPHAYASLDPWLDFFQACALGTFFLLMCQFIASDSQCDVNVFFAAFEAPQKSGKSHVTGLEWFRKQWIAIVQYPVVSLLVAVATDITQAAKIYCLDSNKPYFAHIWLMVISTISVAVAVLAVLKFYKSLKTFLASHQPLAKLLAFKLIVGLAFLESIIFTILRTTNVLKETSTLSYADVNIGIPNLVTCLQMVPFALFFPYAYRTSPYIGAGPYQGGFLGYRAWIGVYNPMELLHAIKFAFGMATEMRKQGGDSGDSLVQGRTSYSPPTAPPYTYHNLDSTSTAYEQAYDMGKPIR